MFCVESASHPRSLLMSIPKANLTGLFFLFCFSPSLRK
jgi:hypothetical protein